MRAISRSRMPEAKAVLSCSHVIQRISGNACAIEHKELRERLQTSSIATQSWYPDHFRLAWTAAEMPEIDSEWEKVFQISPNFASRFP